MIDVIEVKAELESGNLVTEMHEMSGKKYLLLRDTESGESVCIWREEWEEQMGVYDDCLHVVVPKQKWIWCEDSLPNEDEIAYTTMVNVSGERDISDKVLVCDTDLNIYAAYFIHTGTPHKYYGTCLTNEYTLMHSRIGQAGWQCTENKYGWSKRIDAIAWVPLPEL